jgi:type III secretion system chaperone SycN
MMPELPFQARAAIEALAASLGLPFRPAPDGSVGFRFQRSGTLSVTPTTDSNRVVMSLAWRPATAATEAQGRLLAAAGLDATTGDMIQTGMAPDESFVCAMSLDATRLDLPTIDAGLRALMAVRDRVG